MKTGQIHVSTENIFPIIKKFLYSDHEIFLRELVSNAVDASQKLKVLASTGEYKGELGELKVEVLLDKQAVSSSEVQLSAPIVLAGKTILLVDDVLNTGKTLVYALKPFLGQEVEKMEIAVLVNRSHGLFPVKPDYTGFELATTFNEHIRVDFSENNYSVHLL